MKQVAKLDADGAYWGVETVSDAEAKNRVVVSPRIDLPPDGTYKWTGSEFMPLGYGFRAATRPSVDADYAMFLALRALVRGEPIPSEVAQYVDWYDANMRARNEERAVADKRRSGR